MVAAPFEQATVRAPAEAGRVRQHHTWHGGQKHDISFHVAATALSLCQKVVQDHRQGPDGKPRHPNGHVAWATTPHGALRIDFNLEKDETGKMLALVTAMVIP